MFGRIFRPYYFNINLYLQAAAAFYGHSGSFTNSKFHYPGSSLYDFTAPQNMSPSSRMGTQQSLVQSMSGFNSLGSSNISDIQRIRDEFSSSRLKMSWDESSLPGRSVSIFYFLFIKLHKELFIFDIQVSFALCSFC